ncbi:MAG: hypothetical protein WDM96_00020 [Lacunisphaera sp.]
MKVSAVSFDILSQSPAETSLQGEATLIAEEDTFAETGQLKLKRAEREIVVKSLKLVKKKGDAVQVPFQAKLTSPGAQIDLADLKAWGQPLAHFKPAVVEGTPAYQKVLELNAAWQAAAAKTKQVEERWNDLKLIKSMAGDYDTFVTKSAYAMRKHLESAFGDRALAQEYAQTVEKKKSYPTEKARYAAFVRLVTPHLDEEYSRIEALINDSKQKADAYMDFMAGL